MDERRLRPLTLTAQEIEDLPRLRLGLDYLVLKVRALMLERQAHAVYITPDDAATIIEVLGAAAEILHRIRLPYRRYFISSTAPTVSTLPGHIAAKVPDWASPLPSPSLKHTVAVSP